MGGIVRQIRERDCISQRPLRHSVVQSCMPGGVISAPRIFKPDHLATIWVWLKIFLPCWCSGWEMSGLHGRNLEWRYCHQQQVNDRNLIKKHDFKTKQQSWYDGASL